MAKTAEAPVKTTKPRARRPVKGRTPTPQRYRFTPELFHRLGQLGFFEPDQRVELIEGDILTMPPEGTEHAFVKTSATHRFTAKPSEQWHLRVEAPTARASDG
jgi:Uma2 family endonuclease